MSVNDGPAQPGQPNSRKKPGTSWNDVIEDRLRDARERGLFEDLSGKGQPLHNTPAQATNETWMAQSLLKNAGFLPPAIELCQEIDAELAVVNRQLDRLARRRADLVANSQTKDADRFNFNVLRAKALDTHRAALKALNSKILTLNLSSPPALHRRGYRIDDEIARLEALYPPL